MVRIESLEQSIDVWTGKSADVLAVIYVARRGTDKDEAGKVFGLLVCGQYSDHRTDGMADKDDGSTLDGLDDLQYVVSIPV